MSQFGEDTANAVVKKFQEFNDGDRVEVGMGFVTEIAKEMITTAISELMVLDDMLHDEGYVIGRPKDYSDFQKLFITHIATVTQGTCEAYKEYMNSKEEETVE